MTETKILIIYFTVFFITVAIGSIRYGIQKGSGFESIFDEQICQEELFCTIFASLIWPVAIPPLIGFVVVNFIFKSFIDLGKWIASKRKD